MPQKSEPPLYPKDHPVLDLLPPDLQYLVEPVRRYHIDIEAEIDDIIENITDQELEQLQDIGARMKTNQHNVAIGAFLDQWSILDYEESAHLYFFTGLLDFLDISFDY